MRKKISRLFAEFELLQSATVAFERENLCARVRKTRNPACLNPPVGLERHERSIVAENLDRCGIHAEHLDARLAAPVGFLPEGSDEEDEAVGEVQHVGGVPVLRALDDLEWQEAVGRPGEDTESPILESDADEARGPDLSGSASR